MKDVVVILCTAPDEDAANRLARGLVKNSLAACVNIVPAIRSIYRWQGALQDDAEVLMVIKSTLSAFAALEAWLLEHHPYDVPEILALPVEKGSGAYLDWVCDNVD
jgi:periplasmic divalent cation tolerance protein